MFLYRSLFIRKPVGIVFCMAGLALCLNPHMDARAQTQCETSLEEAERKYFDGEFEQAIQLADSCLNKGGISKVNQTRAYQLRAVAYLALDDIDATKGAIRKLLQSDPDYQPNHELYPSPYPEIVAEVRKELEQPQSAAQQTEHILSTPPKPGGAKKWLFIAGGVGAAAAAALLLGGNGGGDNGSGTTPPPAPLPDPPPLP